jgi:crotonobetainyl-CoA:carnitine CoA-transferase CaiB-like acyl-CoA transferase
MTGLKGIRVLDFSHALAGPLCTYHLALLGADVIKVERPEVGDDLRHYTEHAGAKDMSAPFVAANAGKRSITLDLKTPLGQEAVRRLALSADVVIENFRPGVPDKLGIGYEALKAINPKLVYCSLTGFGGTGELKEWAAYDHIIQAMSGIMWLNGEPTQGPLKVGLPFADTFSGYVAAFSIMAALFQRERGGEGQFIDISMLDATLMLLSQGIATYQMSGAAPIRTGNRGYRLVATADTYPTRDGYLSIGANHQHQFVAMCEALGWTDILQDPRFATHRERSANNDALRSILEQHFAQLNADDLEQKLAAAKVPVSKVRSIPEILQHPHVRQRGMFVETTVPGMDQPVQLTGSGFRFGPDLPARTSQVPGIGQHTAEILRELGLPQE